MVIPGFLLRQINLIACLWDPSVWAVQMRLVLQLFLFLLDSVLLSVVCGGVALNDVFCITVWLCATSKELAERQSLRPSPRITCEMVNQLEEIISPPSLSFPQRCP